MDIKENNCSQHPPLSNFLIPNTVPKYPQWGLWPHPAEKRWQELCNTHTHTPLSYKIKTKVGNAITATSFWKIPAVSGNNRSWHSSTKIAYLPGFLPLPPQTLMRAGHNTYGSPASLPHHPSFGHRYHQTLGVALWIHTVIFLRGCWSWCTRGPFFSSMPW